MSYSATASWAELYSATSSEMAYPAEGVIRIFKGRFPDLDFPADKTGQSILDMGCGDGRHLPLFHSLGMRCAGAEINEEICEVLRKRMAGLGIDAEFGAGVAADLPFEDARFDHMLSWNSCYYMSAGGGRFQDHVTEMARVIKPGGWLTCSIPKKTSFIFRNSDAGEPGYRTIRDDHFGVRNGEVMRCMEDRADLVASFDPHFTDFAHADLDMEWFGLSYHWHVFVARKRG